MTVKFGVCFISKVSITISNAGTPLGRSSENISLNCVQNEGIINSRDDEMAKPSTTKDHKTDKITIGKEPDKGNCTDI